MCNSVDLPAPDGPTNATTSPAATTRSAPRRTSSTLPPWEKRRCTPLSSSANSLIAQRLDWIGARGAPRGIERCQERKRERHEHDRPGLAPVEPRRDGAQIIDLG